MSHQPMIRLSTMTEAQYPDYRAWFIEEYARDLCANHGYDLAQGRINATISIDGYLPLGVGSPDNVLQPAARLYPATRPRGGKPGRWWGIYGLGTRQIRPLSMISASCRPGSAGDTAARRWRCSMGCCAPGASANWDCGWRPITRAPKRCMIKAVSWLPAPIW